MFYASYDRQYEPNYFQTSLITPIAAITSTILSHPLNFLKTKIQIYNEGIGITGIQYDQGYNSYKVFTNFHERGYGLRILYTGFINALAARIIFLGARNTFYKISYDYFKPVKKRNDLTYKEKGILSGIGGAFGAILSNPFEIRYIRQIGDVGRSQKFQRIDEITKKGLKNANFRSPGLNYAILRAILLNSCLIYPYDKIKESMFTTFGPTFLNRIVGVIAASTVATILVLPIDNLKTRMQYAFLDKKLNRLNYEGHFVKDLLRILRHEGGMTFYAGSWPYFGKMFLYVMSSVYVCDWLVPGGNRSY